MPIENFRPGGLERLGLGWEALHALTPRLIMVRISGYGQTGPYRDRPGFGAIGEAMGAALVAPGFLLAGALGFAGAATFAHHIWLVVLALR